MINGIDIRSLQINEWYKNVSLCLQEFNLFEFLTVKDKVALEKINKPIDEDKVMNALKKADAWDFVSKYEHGINQILNNAYTGGIKPSTGQAQKIAIARFFYRESPMIILDEPTSFFDVVFESKIFDAIYKTFNDKTVIIIFHRLSTIRKADRIILIDDGNIIQEGTHEQLLKLNSVYANMYNLQMKNT